jgi:hypothetical protein
MSYYGNPANLNTPYTRFLLNSQLRLDEASQYETADAAGLTIDDATKGAMLFTGATVAGAVMLLTKGKMLGVALAAGGIAAFATKIAIDKAAKA